MNLNHLQIIGLLMVIIAVFAGTFLPGTVVYYSMSNPSVSFVPSPSTTSPSNPLQFPAYANSFTVQAVLSGIAQAEVLNASVQISKWSGSSWTVIGTYPLALTSTSAPIIYSYQFSGWGSSGSLYAFSFSILTTDIGSFTGIGYMQIATLTGYFSINGVSATSSTYLRVSNPVLTITYTVTNVTSGAQFNHVGIIPYIIVNNGTVSSGQIDVIYQNTTNGNFLYSITYTLPQEGTYTISGFAIYGTQTYQEMNIIGAYGNWGSTTPLSDFYIIVGVFGAIFFLLGTTQARKAHKEK